MLRMPALRGELQLLSARNDDVRNLCGAFEEASATLERLRNGVPLAPPDVIAEYESLCEQIESDIVAICRDVR